MIIKRTASHIFIIALMAALIAIIPQGSIYAATGSGMLYGKEAIQKNLKKGDDVWFGRVAAGYTAKALWRIGNPKKSNTKAAGAMFVVSEYTWRGPSATMPFNADYTKANATSWEGSDAQAWCKAMYNACFNDREKSNIVSYNKTDEAGNWYGQRTVEGGITVNDYVFLPSSEELWTYVHFDDGKKIIATDINGNPTAYWLRSPTVKPVVGAADVGGVGGGVGTNRVDQTTLKENDVVHPYAYRPAMNIKTDGLLFASTIAAKSGSVGSMHSVGSAGSEYTLTYLDTSRSITVGSVSNDGTNITIAFSGAAAGSNDYVSAMVANGSSVSYYGRLAKSSSSGKVKVPCSIIGDGDTLYLFSEEYSGTYETAYASEPVAISIPEPVKPSPDNPDTPDTPGKPGGGDQPVPSSEAEADEAVRKISNDTDAAGSTFAPLKLRSYKQGKNYISLRWNSPKGAKAFIVYGNKCNTKNHTYKIKRIKKTAAKKGIKIKGLKKGCYYKYTVVAFDSNDRVIAISKTIHVTTSGGKSKNHTAVHINAAKKGKVTVKRGKSLKLKARAEGKKVKRHAGIRYEISDPAVATVKGGKIYGIRKGTCKVYAYAQNGRYKAVTVKVK